MSEPGREARVARGRGSRVADFARGRGSRGAGRRPPATLPTLGTSAPAPRETPRKGPTKRPGAAAASPGRAGLVAQCSCEPVAQSRCIYQIAAPPQRCTPAGLVLPIRSHVAASCHSVCTARPIRPPVSPGGPAPCHSRPGRGVRVHLTGLCAFVWSVLPRLVGVCRFPIRRPPRPLDPSRACDASRAFAPSRIRSRH